jgi:hypothetical protein
VDLELLLFAVPVLIAVVELVLSARWNRTYFTAGIPIFVRRVEKPDGLANVDLEALEARTRPAAGAPLQFRHVDAATVAFREKLFSGGTLHYTPIMHGVIRHTVGEPHVRVIGLANWFSVVFVVVLVAVLGRGIVTILPILLFAIGVIYLIQAVRYNRVAKALGVKAIDLSS